ncbi:DUF1876 domain-containing protein [Streptomyces luteolifulvus]|uniref:DUF1876 domain-containing protein n=1 Tax=Streptomyces luteolifulvus TaxID=2615112 RepID=A0A6H9UPR4_9ACTN|nr:MULTISPECIES: DUF1876 domain-containing protein [Streptomyces]KAB1139870.1 DUF1876 domain-containing protein [Streptomyces luteolifulvus]MXM64675.1 DUF1876 domain-containing protein [Streptomyces sp. HUCO-GS316]
MAHTVEWKVRLYLFEEQGTTKARVVLDTGTTVLTGHGAAHRNPVDADVPEIGDELAAGRAMHDLGRQLVDIAERDIEGVDAPATGGSVRPETGWQL